MSGQRIKRIIPCLDMFRGQVVKGVRFQQLIKAGSPPELAETYERQGADEVAFLDIAASAEGRRTMVDVVQRTAASISIPFIVGGGIRDLDDIRRLLSAGADKVSIGTAAVNEPGLIGEASKTFGADRLIVAIDGKKLKSGRWEVYIYGGRKPTGIDAIAWAVKAAELGAGEILLTSIDADGTREGYDIELTRGIAETANIPVIASGGAGTVEHIHRVLTEGKADAALAASIFHFGVLTIRDVKTYLKERGVTVRL